MLGSLPDACKKMKVDQFVTLSTKINSKRILNFLTLVKPVIFRYVSSGKGNTCNKTKNKQTKNRDDIKL